MLDHNHSQNLLLKLWLVFHLLFLANWRSSGIPITSTGFSYHKAYLRWFCTNNSKSKHTNVCTFRCLVSSFCYTTTKAWHGNWIHFWHPNHWHNKCLSFLVWNGGLISIRVESCYWILKFCLVLLSLSTSCSWRFIEWFVRIFKNSLHEDVFVHITTTIWISNVNSIANPPKVRNGQQLELFCYLK